jgi:hypothetical protein
MGTEAGNGDMAFVHKPAAHAAPDMNGHKGVVCTLSTPASNVPLSTPRETVREGLERVGMCCFHPTDPANIGVSLSSQGSGAETAAAHLNRPPACADGTPRKAVIAWA